MHALHQHAVGSGLSLGTVKLVVSMQTVDGQGINERKPCWKALSKVLLKEQEPKGAKQP